MKIGHHDFELVCAIEPETNLDGSIREFMPQARYRNKKGLPLNNYGNGPFCKFKIPKGRNLSGVYAIVVENQTKYIGECVNLSSRYNMGYGNISPRNCFAGGQETNCRINNLILLASKNGSRLSLWFLPTKDHKLIEQDLCEMKKPDWNRN